MFFLSCVVVVVGKEGTWIKANKNQLTLTRQFRATWYMLADKNYCNPLIECFLTKLSEKYLNDSLSEYSPAQKPLDHLSMAAQ